MLDSADQINLNKLLIELEKKTLNKNKLDTMLTTNDIKINMPLDDNSKKTILHRMIEDNKVLSVKWLFDNHANPYIEDSLNIPAFFTFANHLKSDQMLKVLIQYNIDFNYKSSNGRTVLQDIVLNGDVSLAKKILPYIKNKFSLDNYGKNILFDALSSGNKDMIDLVYSLPDLDINIQAKNKDSLLHFVKDGHLDIIEFLLTKGVSPTLQDSDDKNIIFYLSQRMENTVVVSEISKISKLIDLALRAEDAIAQKNQNGETLLLGFLKNLHKPLGEYNQKKMLSQLIETFIKSGVNIDEQDNEGNTPLLVAVEKNDLETVQLLVNNGADINLKNKEGSTPLSIAVMKGNKDYYDMIKLLLAFEADPNIKDSKGLTLIEKILYILIYVYNYENSTMPFCVSDILNKEQKEEDEDFILKYNEDDYMKDVLEMMISYKIADLSVLDSRGNPYLFILIITQNDSLAKLLIRYGADINQENKDGKNILQYYLDFASENEIEDSIVNKRIKDIIKFGVNLDHRDEHGGTILHNTVLKHPLTITKNIHKCGANIDVSDHKGRTLLHNAIWANNLETMKYIIQNNRALLNTPDKLGILPINYAAFIGSKELVCYLIKEKSYVNNIHEIPQYMINFLKRFHKNIKELEQLKTLSPQDKKDIKILLENMKKEFNIVE
jgi:ankyrin repeat protein